MSILKGFERVPTEDGSLRFLCHLETDVGVIKKSVVVPAGYGTRAQIRAEIIRQITVRAREADRHSAFAREQYGDRTPHQNPRHLYQQADDARLFAGVPRAEVERAVDA